MTTTLAYATLSFTLIVRVLAGKTLMSAYVVVVFLISFNAFSSICIFALIFAKYSNVLTKRVDIASRAAISNVDKLVNPPIID